MVAVAADGQTSELPQRREKHHNGWPKTSCQIIEAKEILPYKTLGNVNMHPKTQLRSNRRGFGRTCVRQVAIRPPVMRCIIGARLSVLTAALLGTFLCVEESAASDAPKHDGSGQVKESKGNIEGAVGLRAESEVKKPAREFWANFDRDRIKSNLQTWISHRAAQEVARLGNAKDWRKVSAIEAAKNEQLSDLDQFLDQIGRAFEQQEASADYALAGEMLAQKGVAETLSFLESKSGERETRIASLKGESATEQKGLREVLREELLTAYLEEEDLRFDRAGERYLSVIANDPAWPEPRNALVGALIMRGSGVGPPKINAILQECIDLCRETLSLTTQMTFQKDLATAQNHLGVALWNQSAHVEAMEAQQLLVEAVSAFREALKVRTRTQQPQEWATTQTNLGNALAYQGQWSNGPERQRLLSEAVGAYREALNVYTQEQSPQRWARTQNNLSFTLLLLGRWAPGEEGRQLFNGAVSGFRAILKTWTREEMPLQWAGVQRNLSEALMAEAELASGIEREKLETEAVEIDRQLAALDPDSRVK